MRAILQRVMRASVEVGGKVIGRIDAGLLVFVAVRNDDTPTNAEALAAKVANLRVFEDEDGKMNLSALDTGGSALVVSNFTLYADTRKGRRPSFNESAGFDDGEALYGRFCEALADAGVPIATGKYGAMMEVSLINSGPVTVIVDA